MTLNGSPVGPRMLVKIESLEEKSESGIVLSTGAKRQESHNSFKGTVIKLGLDCYNNVFKEAVGCEEPWCKPGDKIMFKSHASFFPSDPESGYVVINDQDVVYNYTQEQLCRK